MVTVLYYTAWNPCYLYTAHEGSWKSLPMTAHKSRRYWQQIKIEYLNEFVFTDGKNSWDNPRPGENYQYEGGDNVAVYRGKLIKVEESEPIMLISDLDNTLVGSHQDTKDAHRRFNEYWIQKHYFGSSILVYNTGRSLEEYLELFTQGHKLLDPDMLITAVGSDAYTLNIHTGAYLNHIDLHREYDGEFWSSEIIAQIVKNHFPWMVLPQKRYIYPFKIWVTARAEDVERHRHELKIFLKNVDAELRDSKVIHARAIISGFADWRYIDITPRVGGKRVGVRYAQKYFKVKPTRTIVAGDSGNDIEMFRDPENFGVVVNNADQEMSQWFGKKKRANKIKSEQMWGDGVVEIVEKIFYSS